jgi:hypothetical protein
MNTKLTLRLDDSLITHAKKYAKNEGKSISQIVSDYFRAIPNYSKKDKKKLGPVTTQLRGCLKGAQFDEKEYRQHLERKYL